MATKSARKTRPRGAASGKRGGAGGPRTCLRRLVDELPEAEVSAAARYLTYLRDLGDPFRRGPGVEEADDVLTPEEIAGIEEGRREYLEGKARPVEAVFRDLIDARAD